MPFKGWVRGSLIPILYEQQDAQVLADMSCNSMFQRGSEKLILETLMEVDTAWWSPEELEKARPGGILLLINSKVPLAAPLMVSCYSYWPYYGDCTVLQEIPLTIHLQRRFKPRVRHQICRCKNCCQKDRLGEGPQRRPNLSRT